MRELTEAEKEIQYQAWIRCPDRSPEYSDYEIHRTGYALGLDTAAAQLAAVTAANQELTFAFNLAGETCRKLEAERDALRTKVDALLAFVNDQITIQELEDRLSDDRHN